MMRVGTTGEAMRDNTEVTRTAMKTRLWKSIARKSIELLRMHTIAILLLLVVLSSSFIVLAQQTYHFPVYPTREYMRPLRGGLQIQFVDANDASNSQICSLGYFARIENRYGIITAAHCQVIGPNIVYQPNTSRAEYRIGAPYVSSGDIDAVFVQLDQGVDFEAYIINITGENSYTTVAIYGYVDWDNVEVGDHVCKTGRTTGTTCGYVIDKRNPYDNLLDVIITNVTAASGDSGSPLYYYVSSGGRALATYLLGHLSRGENCQLAVVNGETVYLCPRTVYVSARAIRNIFGATICDVITGC